MAPKSLKWSQMAPDGSKKPQTAPDSSPRWLQMTPDSTGLPQMAPNGSRWRQIAPDRSRWPQMAPDGSRLLQMTSDGTGWLQIARPRFSQSPFFFAPCTQEVRSCACGCHSTTCASCMHYIVPFYPTDIVVLCASGHWNLEPLVRVTANCLLRKTVSPWLKSTITCSNSL